MIGSEAEQRGRRTSFPELKAETKRFLAWNLAQQGLGCTAIGDALGLSKRAARKHVMRAQREKARGRVVAEVYRRLCLERLLRVPDLDARSRDAARRVHAYGGVVDERVDLYAVIRHDQALCHICRDPVEPDELAFDHVVPLVHGGTHSTGNVRVAHVHCNAAKGARLD